MKKLLFIGIVLAACFVGTASDTADLTIKHPCRHDKLKALNEIDWTLEILGAKGGLRTHYHRMYKCKECKVQLLIQQAIVIPEVKCEKQHWESSNFFINEDTITY